MTDDERNAVIELCIKKVLTKLDTLNRTIPLAQYNLDQILRDSLSSLKVKQPTSPVIFEDIADMRGWKK